MSQEVRFSPQSIHTAMAEDPLMGACSGTHMMGYATCQRISLMLSRLASETEVEQIGQEAIDADRARLATMVREYQKRKGSEYVGHPDRIFDAVLDMLANDNGGRRLSSVERELRNSSVVVRDTEYVPLDIALSLLWNLDS